MVTGHAALSVLWILQRAAAARSCARRSSSSGVSRSSIYTEIEAQPALIRGGLRLRSEHKPVGR
jgi:hypothetical protein